MMKKIITHLNWLLIKTTRVFVVCGGLLTIAMIFTTAYAVAMRYFFRRPEPIAYELTTIFMLWAFLLALAFVEYRQDQIRADIFMGLMPGWLRDFLQRIVAPSLALVYCAILAWKGGSVAMYSLKIGERSMSIWGEPLFPIKVMVPVCYFLLTLMVLRNLFLGIASYTKWAPQESEKDSLPAV